MSEVLWTLDDVTLGGGGAPRLDGVSAAIQPGVTAVLGPSGAGKTSLLNLLVGFERPGRGTVTSTLPQGGRALPVYWVPQSGGLWPHLTVREHVELVLPPGSGGGRAMEVLAALDVAERAEARPDELSQGERSRVAVARALAADAAVLVMDEPFASVDMARVGSYWEVVRRHLEPTGASLVFATHSPEAVLAEAERVLCLSEGRLLYEGSVERLYWQPGTREEADCLGEGNWLTPAESRLWLGREEAAPRCFRPEQMAIAPATDSPIAVTSSRFKGSVAEVELEHTAAGQRRRFVHRPVGDGLAKGARVVLRALLTLLVVALAACRGSDEPRLRFREAHTWGMPPEGAKLPSPRVVTIGSGGEAFVIDRIGRVLVLDGQGKLLGKWRMPETEAGHPEGACLLKDGRLAVADTHYNRVVFFDAQGKVVEMLGAKGTGPGEFLYPVGVAQDAEEHLYVCEYGGNDRVQKFTREGEFVLAFGSFGEAPHQFQRPAGLVWHEGKVYVADAGNNRVQVFTDKGGFVETLAEALSLRWPYDISIGPDEALYVIEYGAGRLTKMSLGGELVGRYGSTGRGHGQFHAPWGVAVDAAGRILVADTGNRRMVELRP